MSKLCKGVAQLTLQVQFPVDGEFNPLYVSGIEELKRVAKVRIYNDVPSDIEVEILDVSINNYEESITDEPEI